MLFHVTISHTEQLCPGRRPDDQIELITPSERLEVLGQRLAVTSHYVLWSASCMLWAEPEHVVYTLLEGPNLDAVLRYVADLTPAEWQVRALPVFNLPHQSALVRHVLTQPAMAREQPAATPPRAVADKNGGESPQTAPPDVASTARRPPAPPASEPKAKRGALPTVPIPVPPAPPANRPS